MPIDVQELVRDPDFQSLPFEHQKYALSQADPDIGKLSDGDIQGFIQRMQPRRGTTSGQGKTGLRLKGNATQESPLLSMATAAMIGGPVLGEGAALAAPAFSRAAEAARQGARTAQFTPTLDPRLLYSIPGVEAVAHYLGIPRGLGAASEIGAIAAPKAYGFAKGAIQNLRQEPFGPQAGEIPEGWRPPIGPITPVKPGKGTGTDYKPGPTYGVPQVGTIIPRKGWAGPPPPPPPEPGPESGSGPITIEGIGPVKPLAPKGPVKVSGSVPQTVNPPVTPVEPMQPVDRVEMNRMLHAKVQRLNLPGSPAGQKAPGFLTDTAKAKFGMPYDRLSVDQLKQLYEHLDTLAKVV